jgi:hypothetical protein
LLAEPALALASFGEHARLIQATPVTLLQQLLPGLDLSLREVPKMFKPRQTQHSSYRLSPEEIHKGLGEDVQNVSPSDRQTAAPA